MYEVSAIAYQDKQVLVREHCKEAIQILDAGHFDKNTLIGRNRLVEPGHHGCPK
jgi:hypothetical protein